MINFIKNNTENKSGKCYRINDLIKFLHNNNVKISISNNEFKYDDNYVNIISSLPDYGRLINVQKLPNNLYVMLSNIIFEDFGMNSLKYDTHELFMTNKKKRIIHNTYYNYLFNKNNLDSIFIPMLLLDNIKCENNNDFKYGIFIRGDQPIFEYIFDIVNFFGMKNVLLLSEENDLKNKFNATNDKNYFFNSVESIIDISSRYYSSHVGSRFIFESISCRKNIIIIQDFQPGKIYNRTINQFRNINIIESGKIHSNYYITINIDPRLVMINSYKSYILNILNEIDINHIKKDKICCRYIEDYLDEI